VDLVLLLYSFIIVDVVMVELCNRFRAALVPNLYLVIIFVFPSRRKSFSMIPFSVPRAHELV